jgi:hypothetical protein
MNLDVASVFPFGDTASLRSFMLDHNTVHLATANALTAKYGGVYSTFGLMDQLAEDAWATAMEMPDTPVSPALQGWLELHNLMHAQTYQRISGVGVTAPDLSLVDFSKPDQFYLWMLVHQEMHDYEQQTLGLQ